MISIFEDFNLLVKVLLDYFLYEEMLCFKKLKKKKLLRKKDKLDISVFEVEVIVLGLVVEDFGFRKDGKRQVLIEEKERFENEKWSNVYQIVIVKVDEVFRLFRMEYVQFIKREEDELVDDVEDFYKLLERVWKLVFIKKEEVRFGFEVLVYFLVFRINEMIDDNSGFGVEI